MTKKNCQRGEPRVVLHVEHDPTQAERVRRGFARHRLAIDLRQLSTGEAALDYLLRCGEHAGAAAGPRPDVVLAALRLPGMDGLELLAQLRSSEGLQELPVVVLTTSDAEWTRSSTDQHAPDGCVVQPFDADSFAVLLDVISMVLPAEGTAGS